MRRVSCALIHHPVLDRQGAVVTAAITNIDLHDISRSALSFGLSDFWIVHPVEAQRTLAERIRAHWVGGSGAKRIPDRKPALELLRIVPSLDEAMDRAGPGAELWTTSARVLGRDPTALSRARTEIESDGPPVVIAFGTGWGLADEVHRRASVHLSPIASPRSDGYNHLSVRAAAAILFDRLFGVR